MSDHALDVLMAPRSVVVLGASPREGALGNTVVRNLLAMGFSGPVFPVHPTAREVCGLAAWPDLASLGARPDCAVVCLSADKVLPALEDASRHGVRAAVIFASGFAEVGAEGSRIQRRLEEFAARSGMKICGPNCLGLANITDGISLYSAALAENQQAGDVAVLSHSGSGCIVLSNVGRFGISKLVSIGNGAVLDVHDYLDYLASDRSTRVAALFIETIRNPAAFARAALRMRDAGKPVIALKLGQSEKGATATAAHTGSLSGSAEVYGDFFESCGVIAVEDLDELVESIVLMRAIGPKPEGRGVAIVNVSGGEIALTCDVSQRVGLHLPDLSPAVKERLAAVLPSFGHATNPLDVTGVGVFDMTMYRACLEALAAEPAVAVVAVSQDCPAALCDSQAATYRTIAETVAGASATLGKPVIFYSNVAGGIHPHVAEPLEAAGVPVLQGARASLLALARYLARDSADSADSPAAIPGTIAADSRWTARLATGAPLTERESKRFLADHGLPVTREILATSPEAARAAAKELGFPLVMKIESVDLPHKSDVGGVRLNLQSVADVDAARARMHADVARLAPQARIGGVLLQQMIGQGVEVIAGVTRNDPFGMAVVVGAGGVLVELVRDSALALAPISDRRALRLIGRTRVNALLQGYRGAPPSDVAALASILARLSQLAVTYADWLDAIDLNPIIVGPQGQGACIVDALVIPRSARSRESSGETQE